MTDPRTELVRSGYEALGPRYAAWAAAVEGDPRDRFVAELCARVPSGAPLLELGCGPGVPTTRLLAERFRVLALDISQEQLRLARAGAPGAAFARADIAEVRFPAGSFAAVVALFSVSHVPRAAHAGLFSRIACWLRPGGRLLAALASGESADWSGDWLGVPMFFSSYGAEADLGLLARAGLDVELHEVVEMSEPEGAASFLWVLARRPDAAAGPVRRGAWMR